MRMKWMKSNWKKQFSTTQGENKQDFSYDQATIGQQITGNLDRDLKHIKQVIGHNSDVHFREFHIGFTGVRATIIFVEGLSDKDFINKQIMKPLMSELAKEYNQEQTFVKGNLSKEFLKNHIFSISDLKEVHSINNVVSEVLIGSTALMINGTLDVFIFDTTNVKARNFEEPVSEALVRGPRIGFNEKLSDNTALLRSLGKNESLSIINFQVGSRAKKELVIVYMDGIADPDLMEEVKKRIKKIEMDNLADSGYIEQFIEDNYLSPFPQVQSTERPDRVISALMEGRVAILLDGTPFALIVPVTFSMMLQSPEDYYERWIPGTLIRQLRFGAALISLLGPSLFISFISFHPGLIPTKLAISIIGTREGVPFPALIEALFMEVAIEIMREAGLRLPKPIGPAIGIVGGLIIGEAAVQAGIVSPIMVIVVAITAISSFAIPQYSAGISLRFLRFGAMFCAAVFGLYGVLLFFLLLCSHLVRLKSFGIPYVSPAVSYRLSDWKDFIVRMPFQMMKRRPKMLHPTDSLRKK